MAQIAVAPTTPGWLVEPLQAAGVKVSPLSSTSTGLIWLGFHDPDGLAGALRTAAALEWVQLPSAGVDDFAAAGLLDSRRVWTSAKGAYSRPVAEHALALTLALMRVFPERVVARSWGEQKGSSLYGKNVLLIGAGGVAREILRLLEPFETRTTVLRRAASDVPGAARTVTSDRLLDELPGADVVILAAALTAGTRALIGADELAAMKSTAILINIARGPLVDLDAVTAALAAGRLGGAGVDVTDPEPLPDAHPLWAEPRALITPHSADTWEMIQPLLTERILTNALAHVSSGEYEGRVDPEAGY